MKKIILAALVAAPLCACSSEKSDFDVVSAAVQAAGTDAVVATGAQGDVLVKTPATKELLKVYEQEKTAKFLSTGDFAIEEGNCLVNVVAENEYRVFCGTMEDVASGEMYAVSVVKPVVVEEAAVAEETAPVAEETTAEAPAAEAEATVAE